MNHGMILFPIQRTIGSFWISPTGLGLPFPPSSIIIQINRSFSRYKNQRSSLKQLFHPRPSHLVQLRPSTWPPPTAHGRPTPRGRIYTPHASNHRSVLQRRPPTPLIRSARAAPMPAQYSFMRSTASSSLVVNDVLARTVKCLREATAPPPKAVKARGQGVCRRLSGPPESALLRSDR